MSASIRRITVATEPGPSGAASWEHEQIQENISDCAATYDKFESADLLATFAFSQLSLRKHVKVVSHLYAVVSGVCTYLNYIIQSVVPVYHTFQTAEAPDDTDWCFPLIGNLQGRNQDSETGVWIHQYHVRHLEGSVVIVVKCLWLSLLLRSLGVCTSAPVSRGMIKVLTPQLLCLSSRPPNGSFGTNQSSTSALLTSASVNATEAWANNCDILN
jgi:hypothetical protein